MTFIIYLQESKSDFNLEDHVSEKSQKTVFSKIFLRTMGYNITLPRDSAPSTPNWYSGKRVIWLTQFYLKTVTEFLV